VTGDPDVSITAGNIGGPAFATEVRLDLVPVAFGAGVRFFGDYSPPLFLLENPEFVQGDRVTHPHSAYEAADCADGTSRLGRPDRPPRQPSPIA